MRQSVHKSLSLILFILLFSHAHHALAERSESVEQACDSSGSGNGRALAFGGKPISLLSGIETFNRTDLSLGNLSLITVTRNYDSSSGYNSPLGYGWGLNYDKRLYTYPDGSITLRKDCGGKTRFTWGVTGYSSSAGDASTLVQNTDGTYTYADKFGQKENYDAQGRLMNIISPAGNSLSLTYELDTRTPLWGLLSANLDQTLALIVSYDYRLSRIEEKDSTGVFTNHWVLLHYDSTTGRLTDIVDYAGRTVTYTQDSIGNLTGVAGPGGSATYGYTDATNKHFLISIDEGNGAYVNTYDTYGRVTRQTHGTGTIDFAYTNPFTKTIMTTTIKDGTGNLLNTQTRTVEFDTNGVVVKVTDTSGNVTIYVRDANSWITREEYWENTGTVAAPNLALRTAMNFTYDSKGNVLTKTEAQGTSIEKTTTWPYDPTYSKVLTETVQSVVDPAQNKVITNTYDSNTGNLLTVNEAGLLGDGTPYSYTTSYELDSNGRITSIDGPRTDVNDVTTFTYDSTTGFFTSITQPIIGSTTYSNHDALGNPQTVTDPNGNSTIYTYDSIGRVTSVKAPGDTNATQYFYVSGVCTSCGNGGANKIDHITLPEGNTIWYTYDTMGYLSTIKDNANNTINYTYDSEGNKLTEQIKDSGGSLQKSLSYQYDALNRLSKTINPDSTFAQFTYDTLGNRKTAKDPKGSTTNYNYDALNRLVAVVQPGTITTSYGYNTSSKLTTVTDTNGRTTTYVMDDAGRVFQVISPDTGTTTYTYDAAGNMVSKTDAKGITIAYTYDAANRLTQITFPDTAQNIGYVYDNCPNGKGRLCRMVDQSGTTSYEYSAKLQLTKETKTIDSIQYVTQYSYDMNGNLKTMTYPSGRVVVFNTTNDRVVSILNNAASLASNISYKPFGGMASITYANGIVGTIGYDNQYRVTSITAGTALNLDYNSYDANGNITGITNNLDATKSKSFTYDSLDRLSTATSSGIWGSLAWTYDGVGNRQTEGSTVYSYAPGTNKLTGVGGSTYSFDNDGNTISDSTRGYTYNQNQRLIQAMNGATTANYTYNGMGQRVKKVVNGVTTIFHYNRAGQIIAESDSTGATTAEYVYLNSQPLAKIGGTNVYYYHNDHLGTPQKMTDATGVIVWAADYKPFGEATVTVSTITNNLRFPGQYFDAETGRNYNVQRNYNSPLGRYDEADPIGQWGALNLYGYVGNNPVKFIDPWGLFTATVYDSGGRNGSTYGGTMTVTNNGQSITVNVSSWPNPTNPGPGIASTQFNLYTLGDPYSATYSTTGHHGSDPAISLTGTIPTNGDLPNPNNGGLNWAIFVQIHCGTSMTNRGSANCITVQPDQCQILWNFLQNAQTGTVSLTR